MPKAKKTSDVKSEKKIAKKSETKPKAKTKTLVKKTKAEPKAKHVVKHLKKEKLIPEKTPEEKVELKAKPVIIDVIEDNDDDKFFPDLPISKPVFTTEEEVQSEEKPVEPVESEESTQSQPTQPSSPADIDQQKKFFSQLITEIKDDKVNPLLADKTVVKESEDEETSAPKSLGLYRRLVWRFLAFTAVLLLAVFYFSFSKLTIIVSPKGEEINDNLLLKVQSDNASSTVSDSADNDFRELVSGTVNEVAVSEEKTYPATGEEFTGEEVSGKVKIINNSNKAQALVAKTRLLSPDNKLYRIKEAVNVPAGGEVEAEIYVDKPSEDLAISATSFTIPGLWLGLQDKIFAKSSEDFVYQQKVKKYIKASDIEQATSDMNAALIAKAKLEQTSSSKDEVVLYENLNAASFENDSKVGDAKESFTLKASSSMAVVTVSKSAVAKLAAAKLSLLVPDDKELVGYSPDDIVYTLDNYDPKTKVATIKASFKGTMVLKNDTEIIDKKQLVNLNQQQLENYLKTFPEIKNYELKFFPSFITRAPRLPEKISIEIKGLEK